MPRYHPRELVMALEESPSASKPIFGEKLTVEEVGVSPPSCLEKLKNGWFVLG